MSEARGSFGLCEQQPVMGPSAGFLQAFAGQNLHAFFLVDCFGDREEAPGRGEGRGGGPRWRRSKGVREDEPVGGPRGGPRERSGKACKDASLEPVRSTGRRALAEGRMLRSWPCGR